MDQRRSDTVRRRLRWLVAGLLVAHCIWCAARVPTKVVQRRWQDVAEYRALGPARYFLDRPHQQGADVVEWILANVRADAVVLWRGTVQGSLEFVPALIAPRLLVAESACPAPALEYAGRPLATRADGAATSVVVVEGHGPELRLGVR